MTYPYAIYGCTSFNILIVALFNLTNTALCICNNRNNCNTLRTFGDTRLILFIIVYFVESLKTNKIKINQ